MQLKTGMLVLVAVGGLAAGESRSDARLAQDDKPPKIEIVLDADKKVKMEFVLIKAGTFTMGDAKGDKDETPHEVTLTKDYWMQTTPTTQAQWNALMGSNRSKEKGGNLPVVSVNWNDCQEFMKKLNEKAKDQLKGRKAGLPTEAEWEYACRAGEKGKWCFGDDEKKVGDYAWTTDNSDGKSHPVGKKKANAWGLYDMHGNVWEWCEDWYGDYAGKATDPSGPASGKARVRRGGSYVCLGTGTRSARRMSLLPLADTGDGGLRAVMR